MSLSNLIRRKSQTVGIATATPATFATPATLNGKKVRTVASVATVNVAKPPQGQSHPRQLLAGMTAEEETAVRAWLALIDETDPSAITEAINQCQKDASARNYFTRRVVAELPQPGALPDDRRTCSQCANLRQKVCSIAKPEHGALVVANRGYRPDPLWQLRCVGYAPLAKDSNQQTGAKRWPGLMQTGDK
jgi:hypothetical protein